MGLWAGIKKALNSTVGTSEFEPLDKIIKGQKSIVASDEIYYVISTESKTEHSAEYASFVMNVDGSFKLAVTGYKLNDNGKVDIYINDAALSSITFTSNDASTKISSIISCRKGDKITLMLRSTGNNSTYDKVNVSELSLCAKMVDSSFISVL